MTPTITCGTCEGSGVTPEDHGQGAVEWLGCQDCAGLGKFKMVPVGGLHISRVPCDNCDGGGHITYDILASRECPSCVDGMTWPKWALNVSVPQLGYVTLLPNILDALLEAQEGDST